MGQHMKTVIREYKLIKKYTS